MFEMTVNARQSNVFKGLGNQRNVIFVEFIALLSCVKIYFCA